MTERRLADRYVAFVDILGFSHLVSIEPLPVIAQKISRLIKHANSITIYRGGGGKPFGRYITQHMHFSDSILFWSAPVVTEKDAFVEGTGFSMFIGILIACAATLEKIPLRAGVAFGQIYADIRNRIIVGQPVVDAYRLEQAQEWIGGAFHASVDPKSILGNGQAVRYPVPLKAETQERTVLALDWVCSQIGQVKTRAEGGRREDLLEWIAERITEASSLNIRDKYSNTKTFFESRCEEWTKMWQRGYQDALLLDDDGRG